MTADHAGYAARVGVVSPGGKKEQKQYRTNKSEVALGQGEMLDGVYMTAKVTLVVGLQQLLPRHAGRLGLDGGSRRGAGTRPVMRHVSCPYAASPIPHTCIGVGRVATPMRVGCVATVAAAR